MVVVVGLVGVLAAVSWKADAPDEVEPTKSAGLNPFVSRPSAPHEVASAAPTPDRPPRALHSTLVMPPPERIRRFGVGRAWTFERPQVAGVQASALLAELASRARTVEDGAKVATLVEVLQDCYRIQYGGEDPQLSQHVRGDCQGVTADAYAKADQWLEEVAALGDAEAKYLYASNRLFWLRNVAHLTRDPLRYAAYKEVAVRHLRELADSGNTAALVALGQAAANPYWQEPDPAQAWAYMFAAARARGDLASQAQLSRRLQAMPDGTRSDATRLAEAIFDQCCVRH